MEIVAVQIGSAILKSIFVLTLTCIVLAIAAIGTSGNVIANSLKFVSVQVSSMPLLSIGLVAAFFLPSGSLSYLLPAMLIAGPICVGAVGAAEKARKLTERIASARRRSRIREINVLETQIVVRGLMATLEIVFPLSVLGVLLGEMMDGSSDSIGHRLINTSRALNVRSFVEAILPLYCVVILMIFLLRRLRTAVQRNNIAIPDIDLAVVEYKNVIITSLVAPVIFITIIWYALWFAMPSDINIVRPIHSLIASSGSELVDWKLLKTSIVETFLRIACALPLSTLFAYIIFCIYRLNPLIDTIFVAIMVFIQSIPAVVYAPFLAYLFGDRSLATFCVICIVGIFPIYRSFISQYMGTRVLLGRLPPSADFHPLKTEKFIFFPIILDAATRGIMVAVPQVISIALFCEYYFLGSGVGDLLNVSNSGARFDQFWLGVGSILLLSIVAGGIISVVAERLSESLLGGDINAAKRP